MGLEIERRFLVIGDGWRPHVRWQAELQQGYLTSAADGFTLRVRLSHGDGSSGTTPASAAQAWLTLKAPAPAAEGQAPEAEGQGQGGLVRQEFEYPIPPADAGALLALTRRQLRKRRHGLDLAGGDWVVDVFEGANAPLVVAEVELERPDQPVAVPPWCGLELTGRHELSNAALAHNPLASWPEPRRRGLLVALESF
ncbi:MAG: CYTH domain-containing protein [Prochlorococcaceae cyanobacterium]